MGGGGLFFGCFVEVVYFFGEGVGVEVWVILHLSRQPKYILII